MRRLSVVVVGGGVAGLGAAVTLARAGHRVTVIERDDMAAGEPLDSLDWRRAGIPHFLLPHAFTPRGRKELQTTFPDVFEALIAAGAWDLDLTPKIRGGSPRPDDEELVFLAVRRPLIEWALRRAALAEPRIRIVDGTRASGFVADGGSSKAAARPLVIRGVKTPVGTIDGDLVIDAMGRRSAADSWLAEIGARPPEQQSNDCSILYYCRYYRVRQGVTLADGPWIPGPRGDLGYAAFTTFPGDNGTFCALIATPPADAALKALRHAAVFEAAVERMPALDAWTNPDTSEPITDVLPMGSLQNTLRSMTDGRPAAIGLVAIGDAVCHTDPVASLGLAFALIHARLLVDAARIAGADPEGVALAFDAAARPEMDERFRYVSAIDETRTRLWAGEQIDYAHADGGAYPFFTYAATGVAPLADGDLFRVLVRRNMFLDPLAVLDADDRMQRRLEAFYAALSAAGRPRPGPSRDELLELIATAAPPTA